MQHNTCIFNSSTIVNMMQKKTTRCCLGDMFLWAFFLKKMLWRNGLRQCRLRSKLVVLNSSITCHKINWHWCRLTVEGLHNTHQCYLKVFQKVPDDTTSSELIWSLEMAWIMEIDSPSNMVHHVQYILRYSHFMHSSNTRISRVQLA